MAEVGKGVVARSFYGKIWHPQYLFLAISGFGLMPMPIF